MNDSTGCSSWVYIFLLIKFIVIIILSGETKDEKDY